MKTKIFFGMVFLASTVLSEISKAVQDIKIAGSSLSPMACPSGHLSFVLNGQTWKVYEDGAVVCEAPNCFRLQRQTSKGLWTWWRESSVTSQASQKLSVYSLAQARGTLPFLKRDLLIWKNNKDQNSVSLELKKSSLKLEWVSENSKVHFQKDSLRWEFSELGSQRDFRVHQRLVQLPSALFERRKNSMETKDRVKDESYQARGSKSQRAVAQILPLLKCEDASVPF